MPLAQGKEIGSDILFVARESFGGRGELVHEGETEVMFFRAKGYRGKAAGKLAGGFPADLTAEAGLVPGSGEGTQAAQEGEKDGFQKVPIFSAAGEEATQPEFVAASLVDVDGGEVALTAGGDVEAETEPGAAGFGGIEKGGEVLVNIFFDGLVTLGGGLR